VAENLFTCGKGMNVESDCLRQNQVSRNCAADADPPGGRSHKHSYICYKSGWCHSVPLTFSLWNRPGYEFYLTRDYWRWFD